jgi:hypothetical protein
MDWQHKSPNPEGKLKNHGACALEGPWRTQIVCVDFPPFAMGKGQEEETKKPTACLFPLLLLSPSGNVHPLYGPSL